MDIQGGQTVLPEDGLEEENEGDRSPCRLAMHGVDATFKRTEITYLISVPLRATEVTVSIGS